MGFLNKGWLSAAYAGGLIIATFPFTWLGDRYKSKRTTLLGALSLTATAILLFLFVSNYPAMFVARVLQGAGGAGVWTLGLALGQSFVCHTQDAVLIYSE